MRWLATSLGCAVVLALTLDDATAQSPTLPPNGLLHLVTKNAALEGRVLWMDGSANLERLSTPAGVAAIMEKCRKARINTVVVDVKPLSGFVLHRSGLAPRLKEWKGFVYPEGYDLLKTVIDEAHLRGIKVHAAINVFSEGHKLFRTGPAYQRRSWQSIVYDVERTLIAPDGERRTLTFGVNQSPGPGEIAAFDAASGPNRAAGPNEAIAVVVGDQCVAVLDGPVVGSEGVAVPPDGYLLVGRDAGAQWLLDHLAIGSPVTFEARDRLVAIADAPSEAVAMFVNASHPDVRAYELSIVSKLVTNYELDGIAFDRMRYSSLWSDFSDLSRQQFEAWIGKPLERFPADIYQIDARPGRGIIRGRYFKEWLEWRAKNIRDWVRDAATLVRIRRPTARIGVYVGSWYATYFGVGVNWGADDYAAGYDWMTPGYPATGYAGFLDYLTTGCYYKVATREEARQKGLDEEATVEAAAGQSLRAVNNAAYVYAGLYLLDYRDRPEDFRKALQAAVANSQGVMLFDLTYLEQYNWWSILEETFTQHLRAPHDVPDLLPALRKAQRALSGAAAGTR
jgi:uncharacterized lipoprotein YddW (UPF0748 family)